MGKEYARLGGSVVKNSPANSEDLGLIPGLGRSPGEGNGNPLQYSCLENPMDRGDWRATVHWVTRVRHDLATKPPPPPPIIYMFCHNIKLLLKRSLIQPLNVMLLAPKSVSPTEISVLNFRSR